MRCGRWQVAVVVYCFKEFGHFGNGIIISSKAVKSSGRMHCKDALFLFFWSDMVINFFLRSMDF